MLISVIIPAYNMEKSIVRCLDSIYVQKNPEIEVVVINDGSTDKTKEIVERYIAEHDDLKIILKNITNGGLANARNVGRELSSGKYFIQLDADDFLKAGIMNSIIQKINETDFDICFYGFEDYVEDEHIFNNFYHEKFEYIEDASGEEAAIFKMSRKIWICQGSACYRRELCEINNIRNIKGVNQGEDFYFITNMLLVSKKVTSIPHIGVSISFRNDSMMHANFNLTHLQIFEALDSLKKDIMQYQYLKNKQLLLDYINIEYENNRLNIAKKIIFSPEYKGIGKKISKIKEHVPANEPVNKSLMSKSKRIESYLFNHTVYLYYFVSKMYEWFRRN